ncbi:MTRF1L release factor glutamine methyltransferase isoform X2 [Pyxicephalus adspersus]
MRFGLREVARCYERVNYAAVHAGDSDNMASKMGTEFCARVTAMNVAPHMLHRLLTRAALLPHRGIGSARATAENLARQWQKIFQDGGVPEAKESSEILIAHALGAKTFCGLAGHLAGSPVSAGQLDHIETMARERLRRVPVQYIIGEWDFLDLTLQMRPPVFIPRPETEELVGLVLADCPELKQSHEPRILEVGCGSGAVSLALLHKLPQARVVAIDKTKAAVNLTQENAERLHLQNRIQILHHDILSDPAENLLALGPVDVLVSNPPYIFTEDMSALDPEIIRYEDHTALDGGPDGMNVIRAILSLSPLLLKPKGAIFLEGDPRHPDMVCKWLQSHPELQLQLLSVVKDFCSKPRFIHIRRGDQSSWS